MLSESLGRSCVELHRGTVLETLSLLSLAITNCAGTGEKLFHQNSTTVQFDATPSQSHASNLKMANQSLRSQRNKVCLWRYSVASKGDRGKISGRGLVNVSMLDFVVSTLELCH